MNHNCEGTPWGMDVESAWAICRDLFCEMVATRIEPDIALLHDELLFCLLGGFGVSFELASSASVCLKTLQPFEASWSSTNLEQRLLCELRLPQFAPRCADGSLRRYRFPAQRSKTIVKAREWLLAQADLLETLIAFERDAKRRAYLCDCPGVGPKTASWILRNLGLSSHLAIIDIHVARALKAAHKIDDHRLPRDYELVERAFLDWCEELNAPANAFDLFLWEWERGSLFKTSNA